MSILDILRQLLPQASQPARARLDLGLGTPQHTFAGRQMLPGESFQQALGRPPQESPEAEGLQSLGLGLAGAIGPGGVRRAVQGGIPKFFMAPQDAVPLSPLSKMIPAMINEETGEVMANLAQRGPGGHNPLIESLGKNMSQWKRGFADLLTGLGFTDERLSKLYLR